MALEDHKITREERVIIEDLQRFDGLLKEGWAKPWWREFVRLIEQQKMKYMNELVLGMENGAPLTPNGENQHRGRILALAWILAIDARGKMLHQGDEDNGRRD